MSANNHTASGILDSRVATPDAAGRAEGVGCGVVVGEAEGAADDGARPARRCNRVITSHPRTSAGAHSAAPKRAAPRHPKVAPIRGNVSPETRSPTWTPDCFHPIHVERWTSGTRWAMIRLVTGLEKDCATPAISAAINSIA